MLISSAMKDEESLGWRELIETTITHDTDATKKISKSE